MKNNLENNPDYKYGWLIKVKIKPEVSQSVDIYEGIAIQAREAGITEDKIPELIKIDNKLVDDFYIIHFGEDKESCDKFAEYIRSHGKPSEFESKLAEQISEE